MKIDQTKITIKDLTNDVMYHAKYYNENYDPNYYDSFCDIRLQIVDGCYYVLWGDSSFDQDHRGFWGLASLWLNMTKKECYSVAKELIDDAEDHYHTTRIEDKAIDQIINKNRGK